MELNSPIKTIFKVIVPAARSGILAAIVLGTGRAIGETMAVILVAGNTPIFPESILSPVRTLTVNIAMEHIVNLYKGTIEVNSEPGQGTEFIISWPVAERLPSCEEFNNV